MKLLRSLFAATPATIPDPLWLEAVDSYAFLQGLAPDALARLRSLSEAFLNEKELDGAGGLELSNAARVAIAVQACLPILELGIGYYRGWTGVLVYPDEFVVPREIVDEDGVVHSMAEPMSGEAWDGGPVILSWADVADTGSPGYNVVIHEFAHKIDLLSGDASGIPPLHRNVGCDPQAWADVLYATYDSFVAEVDAAEASIPPDMDPESDEAADCFAHLPLDPYGASDPGEFFAVSSEAFFVHPHPLKAAYPDWYALLARFYRQDPAERLPAA
jgi:Mlc titration factor MtfA (ptsG expression regulator)